MEKFAQIFFLFMIFLLPLGLLSWFGLKMAAKKAGAMHQKEKVREYQTRALWHLTGGLMDGVIGISGYYLVSNRVFPQIDSGWIVLLLMAPSAGIHLWFVKRLDQIRKSQAREKSTP